MTEEGWPVAKGEEVLKAVMQVVLLMCIVRRGLRSFMDLKIR